MFHALSSAEAHVMRTFLVILRRQCGVFSHGLVHDAVFIHRGVSPAIVHGAFQRAAEVCGIPGLKLSEKTWEKARLKASNLLSEARYSLDSRISAVEDPPQNKSIKRFLNPSHDNLWLSYNRIPKQCQ